MCVNYVTVSKKKLFDAFDTPPPDTDDWQEELYQDYLGPIVVHDSADERKGVLANYAMVPKRHMKNGIRIDTMNARDDSLGQRFNYKSSWKSGQLCLVPMMSFFEPNYEAGSHIRWQIGMRDDSPFAVAGIYRYWEEEDGTTTAAFSQITINADDHALMNRFHKSGEEKRSLVIVPRADYDDWLSCRDPERARTFLQPYPAELMVARPAPKPPRPKKEKKAEVGLPAQINFDLF